MKFGGALMNNASNINRVIGLIEEYSCEPLVVVVSAIGKTTNALEQLCTQKLKGESMEADFFNIKKFHIHAAQELMPELPNDLRVDLDDFFDKLWDALNNEYKNRFEAYDSIVSIGEDLSGCIIYHYLKQTGHSVRLLSAKSLIVTDSNFTDASVNWDYTTKTITARVLPVIENNEIVLTQGFTGADEHGNSTTLGREGSDFTAAIIGNILNADEVTIWKNVPGLMNADPAKFSNAIKLDKLSYYEAVELAYYGASVIHPKTIQPLKQKNIPLFVRAYYNSSISPTVITDDTSKDGLLPSIIIKDNQILLSISSFDLSFIAERNLTDIFDAFSTNKIHINLMQNSAVSFSVCFNEDLSKLESLITHLSNNFNLKYNTGLKLITIRHYNENLIDELIGNNKVYLFQKSRVNVQFLLR